MIRHENESLLMDSSSSERNLFDRLAEEFATRVRRGELPSISEYSEQYHELADDIRKIFPSIVTMETFKPKSPAPGSTVPSIRTKESDALALSQFTQDFAREIRVSRGKFAKDPKRPDAFTSLAHESGETLQIETDGDESRISP